MDRFNQFGLVLATFAIVAPCAFSAPDRFAAPKAKTLFASGLRKHAKHDLKGAIADYLAAIKEEDDDCRVHWYLGTAYMSIGKVNEAQQEFQKEREMKKAGLNGETKTDRSDMTDKAGFEPSSSEKGTGKGQRDEFHSKEGHHIQ